MKLYKNKFRIDSTRLKDWDYSSTGYYFVTICTKNKEKCFGDAVNGELNLTHLGKVASKYWQKIPHHFPQVKLDAFVVMPNHIHGIIIINCRGESCIRPDYSIADHREGDHKDRPYGTPPDSIGRMIQAFKSISTNRYIVGVEKHNWEPFRDRLWQRNYYDHIIRNEHELSDIREYIVNSPFNWQKDEENKVK